MQEMVIAARSFMRNRLRENMMFRMALNKLRETQWLSTAELGEYQAKHLAAILRHAARSVPYYRELFAQCGFNGDGHGSLHDLSKVPMLTKQDVVNLGSSLVEERRWGLRFKGTTSGTTGLTLMGYRDLRSIRYENAFIWRQLEWAGMRHGDRRAWIRGDMMAPVEQKKPPFWRFNRADNMLMMSSFHLSEVHGDAYIAALEDFDPVIIQAYPSSIAFLARYLESHARIYRGRRLKGVVTSSETLSADQRRVVEHAFGRRVFDWYGTFERAAAIGTCEHGKYHIMPDYGIVELLPTHDGNSEIVGTGFFNRMMPLLRYRTGDIVVPAAEGASCTCGRAFPIVEAIIGRVDDYVKTPDGRHIGMMAILFDRLSDIWEGQIVQEKLDELRILVVPMRELTDSTRRDIEAKARLLVGPEMKIVVEAVAQIPRTSNGKFRMVISKI